MSYFITLEGIEGVGKTTCVSFIQEYLTQQGIQFVSSREPGGTEIAESTRQVLLKHYDETMTTDTELLLLFACRAQNIATKIIPALEAGIWVISDRFTDASYAYQGGGRDYDTGRIAVLEDWVQGDLRPDRIILLDAPVDIALERVHKRGDLDRIESEEKCFFTKVRDCYLQRAEQYPERYRLVDATQSIEAVQQSIKNVLDELIESAT